MISKFCNIIIYLVLCNFIFVSYVYADFDEKYWEMFAEIQIPAEESLPSLGTIYLDQLAFGIARANTPFTDIRILTNNKVEAPYQIVTKSPETKIEELTVQMLNLSKTAQNETYFEGLIEKTPVIYNMIEILTDEKNFYRQVQLFGSADGQNWNLIRGDAVIFDYSKEEKLRHTKITSPDSNYKYLSIKIINDNNKSLEIRGIALSYQRKDPGIETRGSAFISKREINNKKKESSFLVGGVSSNFPIRKIIIMTPDKNFQRRVEIRVKQGSSPWIKWADDIIYDFNTEKIKESKLTITFPEVSAEEIEFVIKNYDSPPLNITGIDVLGYKKALIFKLDGKQKYYIFWGNPQARTPQYDISQLISKHAPNDIRLFTVGEPKKNPKFIGHAKQLPLTERYKHLLYGIIILLMLGLIVLQYRVIKKTEKK